MTVKRFSLMLTLFILLTARRQRRRHSKLQGLRYNGLLGSGPQPVPLDDPALLEATGLDEEALKAALQDGATLTELTQANNGDVESVIAGFVAAASEAINENGAAAIDGLEEAITDALNQTYRPRFPWWRRHHPMPSVLRAWDLDATILEATGLDADGVA